MKERVLIVDALNLFIRSFIASPLLSSDGSPYGGCGGFLRSLQKLCRETNPSSICVIWDGAGGSKKRKKMFVEYKDGRKPIHLNRNINNLTEEQEEQNKNVQLGKLIEYLNLMPIIQITEQNIEADDIISRICKLRFFDDKVKIIVSSDKDFFQLCNNDTIVLRPIQDEIMNEKRIVEKFGIHPTNFVLARSITGDVSDNLKGVGGAGLKTIAKRFEFLKENKTYTIQQLFDYCEENKDKAKVYNDVLLNKDKVELNYKISQLYSPSISAPISQKIKHVIENFIPEFQQTEVIKRMLSDGLVQFNWDSLFQVFRSITSTNKTFRNSN